MGVYMSAMKCINEEISSSSDEAQNNDNCRGKGEAEIQSFEAKRM